MRRILFTILILSSVLFTFAGCSSHIKDDEAAGNEPAYETEDQHITETEDETGFSDYDEEESYGTISEEIPQPETEEPPETAGEEDPAATAKDPVIIVLDPGHDSQYDTRNHPDLGVNEQDLNLTIALACRDRLKQYDGVEVYMTREDGSCPDAEHKGEYCIEVRTGYATDLDADLFVALHCNGTTGVLGADANGTEVYIPNYSAYTDDCMVLGEMILDNLSELDLYPRGVFVRTDSSKGYYDDGSVQDHYYLISYSVEGGHPGIIIEHAYMDNTHDNAILKDEANLIAMGQADADAIAAYYGLSLSRPDAEITDPVTYTG